MKYYDSEGERRVHRLPPDVAAAVHTIPQAEAYAALWYQQNVAAAVTVAGARSMSPASAPTEQAITRSASKLGITAEMTFETFARLWTGGALHRAYPDHVGEKRSARDDRLRLEKYAYPAIGHLPLAAFAPPKGRELVDRVAAYMTEISPGITSASRRQVLQCVSKVLSLAVEPVSVLKDHPLPRGFLPRANKKKGRSFLYPSEEARVLAHTAAPLEERLFFGILAREGMRVKELLELRWTHVDLENGTVDLDINKTGDPRGWTLDPSVTEALRRWHKRFSAKALKAGFVLADPSTGKRLGRRKFADHLRDYLQKAGVDRALLFERSQERIPLRAHDLRATFITIALATGRSDAWVTDRTGHQSSEMLYRYYRRARQCAELKLGPLAPLHEAIPELQDG